VAGEGDGATAKLAAGPPQVENALEDRRAERTAQMKSALAPVEAGAAERTTGAPQCVEIDLPIDEETLAGGSQLELVIAGDETTIA